MINVILLFIVFGCIIISRTLFIETFQSNPVTDKSVLDNSDGTKKKDIPEKQIKDILVNDQNKYIHDQKILFNSIDNINSEIYNRENKINSAIIKEYIQHPNESDPKNSNDGDANPELPILTDNNYDLYNHKLRMINNKLKIIQNFKIDIIKEHLNFLLNTFKSVKDFEKDDSKNKNQDKKNLLNIIGNKLSNILKKKMSLNLNTGRIEETDNTL